jgi:apolipoprotein N-acyltransferase
MPAVVATVQANVDVGTQWHEGDYGRNLDTYLGLTTAAARRTDIELVFWPENTMTFFLEPGTPEVRSIARALASTQTELVAGGPTRRPAGGRDGFFNSAHLVRPDGTLAGRYDKQYVIPFGERFPIVRSEAVLAAFAREREFAPGPPSSPLPTRAGPLGMLVCNEALFPGLARDHVRRGARFLGILANDGWTTSAQYGETALQYARMRAIETRRWVVRSSTSGPSALVDPCGTVARRTSPFTQAVLAGTIVPRSARTPYVELGDVVAWSCVVVLLGWLVVSMRDRSVFRARVE